MDKQITLLIKQMVGGGAERVVSLLCNALLERGFDVTLIVTHQLSAESDIHSIDNNINVIFLEEELKADFETTKKVLMLKARLFGKINRLVLRKSDDQYLIEKYRIRNYDKVNWLKKFFSDNSTSIVVAFLYDSIYLSLLSVTKGNRVIISERGDPQQCLESKTNLAFFRTMFPKADEMVFQSPDAMQWYRDNTNVKGKVIFNPIKPDLPDRYIGERKKKIVNFCRISPPKKLDTLIDAFDEFAKLHNDYELYIFGNSDPVEAEYYEYVKEKTDSAKHKERIHLLPALHDIHNEIIDYSMFVSSSYFEGMSNSMLEAMAIGLPTICTDCPAGGARATIKDHENGILVPVNDAEAMCKAMCEVADNPELAEKLSINGTKLKEDLAVDKIVNQWMEIING